MTIKELMKALENYDDRHEIRVRNIYDGPDTYEFQIKEISEIEEDENGIIILLMD